MRKNNNLIKIVIASAIILSYAIANITGISFSAPSNEETQTQSSVETTNTSNSDTSNSNSVSYSTDGLSYASIDDAISALNNITISEADNNDYSRDEFGSWSNANGKSTRVDVLINQADDYTLENNKVVSGTWTIKYTGETVTYDNAKDISNNLQIDHIVPVSYAFHHGASSWDTDKKEEFYNDDGTSDGHSVGDNKSDDYSNVGNLIVSDRHSNISKSDSGPADWMPEDQSYWVNYCESWIKICNNYGVSLSQADYDKILEVLNNAK